MFFLNSSCLCLHLVVWGLTKLWAFIFSVYPSGFFKAILSFCSKITFQLTQSFNVYKTYDYLSSRSTNAWTCEAAAPALVLSFTWTLPFVLLEISGVVPGAGCCVWPACQWHVYSPAVQLQSLLQGQGASTSHIDKVAAHHSSFWVLISPQFDIRGLNPWPEISQTQQKCKAG